MCLKLCLTILFVLCCCCGKGQNEVAVENDSILMAYYKKCKANLDSPIALDMCDTLFVRSEKAGNRRLMAIAKCLKLDYYYYKNDEENILKSVKEAKLISRKYNQLKYYYFAWGSRLIIYYLKQNKANIALYEVKKMLQEARKDNYMRGVAECYRCMANIYLTQDNYRLAYDNFKKTIEIVEENNIADINIPSYYASLAQAAVELKRWDEAKEALEKGLLLAQTDYQSFTTRKAYALYYIKKGQLNEAWKYIQDIEKLFIQNKDMATYIMGLYYLKETYYSVAGQYSEALKMVDAMMNDSTPIRSKYMDYKLVREQGNIYWKMGDKLKAAEFYYDYIAATDSVRTKELQNSATEFSSILELEQLKNERNELQLSVQKDQLHTVYLVLIFVVLFWIMGGILFFRIYKLNKRLKASELIVNKQNKDLKIFADELMKAKERAEYASMMKTTFIQNMSHEIRTPLNSIVGFSQLLVDIYQDNQETKEFVSIIEVNSANLLRLINDVLDISFLDQSEEVPYDKVEDINVSCLSGIEAVRTLVHEGVELEFRPSVERCLIKTNPGRVSQILIYLLQNAAKFTDKGSIVLDYELNRNEREIIYRITDTGKGIPADKQEYVFERFTKLDDFTQGTGLGLSICRLIAEKLGGTLVVDKEYTVGCRFILTLPLIEV